MATVEEPRTFIRPDGKEKVTGTGRYTADLVLAGQLVAKFRYADHAHARITRIDTTRARALPGVLAVEHWGAVSTSLSNVTSPLRARARPRKVTPLVIEIVSRARTFPSKAVPEPKVAELPTFQ